MRYAAELEWREPSHLEELLAMVGDIPRGTLTVLDDNLVHTGEVKNGELMTPRGMWAYCQGYSLRLTGTRGLVGESGVVGMMVDFRG